MSGRMRQKARGLIELASDTKTSDGERAAAALQAVALIKKHDLLASPLDGIFDPDDETVQAATTIFQAVTNPDLVESVKKLISKGRSRRRRRR